MLSVIKHAVDAIFFFQQHSVSAPSARRAQHSFSAYSAKLHFIDSYGPANTEEIKQQLVELRQTINTAYEKHDFRVSTFLQVQQRH